MRFSWTSEQADLSRLAHTVASDAVRQYGAISDSWMTGHSRDFSRELAARGWIGMTWPREHGGAGRPTLDRFIVTEALLELGAPVAATWFADRQVGPSLIAFGTDEQRARFLPEILRGEVSWCIGMSEPNAGSDVASVRTRARREGDDWIVSGQKVWTSFAASADYCYLICRTSGEPGGHEGISELIVPMDSPGITVRPIRDMAGGEHFCEVFFDDVHVAGNLLVGEPGAAFRQTMRQLEHERGGIDRLFSNRVLYVAALPLADQTRATVRQEIGRLEHDYHVGRLMVIREALRQGPPSYSAVTKAFCTQHEQSVAGFVWRTMGMDSLVDDGFARSLAYSASYTIMGGTNEILRNIIAERMLALPREPVATG